MNEQKQEIVGLIKDLQHSTDALASAILRLLRMERAAGRAEAFDAVREDARARQARHRAKSKTSAQGSVTSACHVTSRDSGDEDINNITSSSTSNTPPRHVTSRDTLTRAAEKFWQALPQISRSRSSRAQVAEAWKKFGCEANADAIIAGLEQCKRSHEWTRDGGQAIPGGHRVLKREVWDNPPPPPGRAMTKTTQQTATALESWLARKEAKDAGR